MRQRRALTAFLCVVGSLAGGCGGGAEPPVPVPPGFVAVEGTHFSFVRPSGWSAVAVDEQPPGKQAVAFESALGAHGLPTQVGVGAAEDYPNSLRGAVAFAKGESKVVYPGFRVTGERSFGLAGAEAVRVDSVYASFAPVPSTVRGVDLYVQTASGVQLNLFVRGPEEDWDEAKVTRMIDSLRVR
jgi:hypothetical protein